VTADGQAIDPATLTLILQIIMQIIGTCKKQGASTMEIVGQVRTGTARSRMRRKLRSELGSDEYKRRGGAKYADKIINAGMGAKVADIKGFVKESLGEE